MKKVEDSGKMLSFTEKRTIIYNNLESNKSLSFNVKLIQVCLENTNTICYIYI